jgi:hypothetical protein
VGRWCVALAVGAPLGGFKAGRWHPPASAFAVSAFGVAQGGHGGVQRVGGHAGLQALAQVGQGSAALCLQAGNGRAAGFGLVKAGALQQQLAAGVGQLEIEQAVFFAVLLEGGQG